MLTLSINRAKQFSSSADLSDNTVRNILQICALWPAYETKDFVFHIAQLQLVKQVSLKKNILAIYCSSVYNRTSTKQRKTYPKFSRF